MIKKFIDSIDTSEYEVQTDSGWVDITSIHKTIPYTVFHIKTNKGKELFCADTHILFDDFSNEVYVKDLEIGSNILTVDGVETVVYLENLGYSVNMYDLELTKESQHRYYTNDILSHNTFLAKKLAEELFGSEKAMIRFDMSEYSDRTGVNKLIGSNPGYVGYDEGGLLTEAIKNKKHCILLLDEFEKAHDEIYNIFLQVFDEGFLTDNSGQKVDFRNVIILLTSNVGAKTATEKGTLIGFQNNKNNDERAKEVLSKELKKRFTPEFLNRLDTIIYFNTLTENDLKTIIKLEIDKSVKRFKDIGYNIQYDDLVIAHIYKQIEDESDYGARPIIRAIQNDIEDVVTDVILDGCNQQDIKITVADNKVIIH